MPSVNDFLPITQLEQLYGREQLLQNLVRAIFETRTPHSQQLVGLSHSGKTSLLNVLETLNLAANESTVRGIKLRPERLKESLFVRVDAKDLQHEKFWTKLDIALTKAMRDKGISDKPIREKHEKRNIAFAHFKEALEWLVEKIMVVFLFDDCDFLSELPTDIIYDLRLLMQRFSAKLVLVTTTKQSLFDITKRGDEKEDFMLLASFFERKPLYVGRLEEGPSKKHAEGFLQMLVHEHQLTDREDLNFLRIQGGYHPYLTRVACAYLARYHRFSSTLMVNYKQLAQEIVREVSGDYKFILAELSVTQRKALLHIINGTSGYGIPEPIWNELLGLGFIVRSSSSLLRYTISSALLAALIEEEEVADSADSDIIIWPEQRAVQIPSQPLQVLTRNEWRLFTYLKEHDNQLCTREDLWKTLYPDNSRVNYAVLDTTISRLRKKIDSENQPSHIVTVRGLGYRYEQLSSFEQQLDLGADSNRALRVLQRNIEEQSAGDTLVMDEEEGYENKRYENKRAVRILSDYTSDVVEQTFTTVLDDTEPREQAKALKRLRDLLSDLLILTEKLLQGRSSAHKRY